MKVGVLECLEAPYLRELVHVLPQLCQLIFLLGVDRLQQSYEVGHYGHSHSQPLSIAGEVALRLGEESLEEETHHVQRHAEEYEGKSYLPYKVEGKAVEEEPFPFVGLLPLLLKVVGVGKIVDHQVDQEEDPSQAYEAGQPCSNPAEVVGKIEKHVDSFHGVGRSGLLEVLLDAPEVEDAHQKPQGQQSAEDGVDGVKRGNREVCDLHDGDHLEGDSLPHPGDEGDENSQDGQADDDVGGDDADVVEVVLVVGVEVGVLVVVGHDLDYGQDCGGDKLGVAGN